MAAATGAAFARRRRVPDGAGSGSRESVAGNGLGQDVVEQEGFVRTGLHGEGGRAGRISVSGGRGSGGIPPPSPWCRECGGEVTDRFMVEVFAGQRFPVGVGKRSEFGVQKVGQHFGSLAIGLGQRWRLMAEPAFQEAGAPGLAAPVIRGSTAREQRQPSPEFRFSTANPEVPDGAEQRLLQTLGGGVLVPAAEHEGGSGAAGVHRLRGTPATRPRPRPACDASTTPPPAGDSVPTGRADEGHRGVGARRGSREEPTAWRAGGTLGSAGTAGGAGLEGVRVWEEDRPRLANTDLIISTWGTGRPKPRGVWFGRGTFSVGRSFFSHRDPNRSSPR